MRSPDFSVKGDGPQIVGVWLSIKERINYYKALVPHNSGLCISPQDCGGWISVTFSSDPETGTRNGVCDVCYGQGVSEPPTINSESLLSLFTERINRENHYDLKVKRTNFALLLQARVDHLMGK